MRDYVLLYCNGKPHHLRGPQLAQSLANFLREELRLPGTKIVCNEGDCGACTVLYQTPVSNSEFRSVNACVLPVALADCWNIVTIEGMQNADRSLSEVQRAMVETQGTQCGFCTPGMVRTQLLLIKKERSAAR